MITFFLKYAKGFWLKIGLSLLFSCLTVLSAVGLMGLSAYLIILAGFHPSIALLQTSIVGVRFFGLIRGLFRYLERLTTHQVNFLISGKIQLNVFNNISSRFFTIIDRYSGSEILSIVLNDINILENLYVKLISPGFATLIISIFLGLFFGMFAIEIVFVYVFGFLLIGLVIPSLSFKVNKMTGGNLENSRKEYQSAIIDFNQFLFEAIFFQSESILISRLNETEKKLRQNQTKYGIWYSIWNLVSFITIQGTFLATLVISGWMVQSGKLESMMMGVISLMVLTSFEVVSSLPSSAYLYNDLRTSSNRIREIGNIPELRKLKNDNFVDEIFPINFMNVSYSYGNNPNNKAVSEINFEIKKGEKFAIVGMNGAGKTTLMEILLGFRKDYIGQILFNNQELKLIPEDVLRKKINYLPSKPHFFSTTIRQNLLLAKNDAEDQTLNEVLRELGLYDQRRLHLDTYLDEFGKNFSSGELQKLAIAQLLLLDGDVIILDEPYANLDPISAYEIDKIIKNIFIDKSLLIITHNLRNMEFFDNIIVMDQGRICQLGNHRSLQIQNGKYKALLDSSNFY
jgi:ATP-binding cassette subfamily C protein CydC